jgi:CxxC motif-containing protein
MIRTLICIRCPIGCPLEVILNDNAVSSVSGHDCPRGEDYAIFECTSPTRMLTTTVLITGGQVRRLPVRTRGDIPKEQIMACMDALHGLTMSAPVHLGDVVLANAAGTGVDIIATRSIPRV